MARNLFSSFIRSAVNQVGRDSGKVISNAVYGDRHATPIRHVGSKGATAAAGGTSTTVDEAMLEKAVARQNINVGTWTLIWYLFLGLIVPIIGPLLLLYHGIKRLSRKQITIRRIVYREVYVPGEMGKDEKERFAGHEAYVEKEKVPSTEHELKLDRKIGTIYTVAGIVLILFNIYIIVAAQ